jgi:hypothetical protein
MATAPPYLSVALEARERRHRPLVGVSQDDVGVAEQHQRRPVARPAHPRDEARALRRASAQLGLDPRLGQVRGQVLGRSRLVAGRVRRVDADQAGQQVGGL